MNLSKDMELCSPHDAFKRFMDISESGTWKCTATRTVDGRVFDMLEKESGEKFPIVKCVGVLKTTPEKILDFFLNADLDARKKVTPIFLNMRSSRNLERIFISYIIPIELRFPLDRVIFV